MEPRQGGFLIDVAPPQTARGQDGIGDVWDNSFCDKGVRKDMHAA